VADLTGDGIPDLIVTNLRDGSVSVLLGNGDGTFQPQQTFSVGNYPTSVAVADLTGDGIPDLIVTNLRDGSVSVLLGNGDGTFQTQKTIAIGNYFFSVAVADVNGDGKPDLIVANYDGNSVRVLLGNGDGTFTPTSPSSGVPLRNTPYLADLSGDGILDSVILDSAGNILVRKGLPGGNNQFASPVIINAPVFDPQASTSENLAARDLTILSTGTGSAIATADSLPDPNLLATTQQFVYSVSLYTQQSNGTFGRTIAFTTDSAPTRIIAGDLTAPVGTTHGLDDLVVANSLDNSVTIAFQTAPGVFDSKTITIPVGITPSDIALTDVNGDGLLDIVVTDQASGDITVLLNDPTHSFQQEERFRAGTGLFEVDTATGTAQVSSLNQSVSLAAGNFTGDGRNDLVVVNRGAHSFTVLPNDGNGGFHDPQADLTTSTSAGLAINEQPGPVVTADFHGTDGLDPRRSATGDLAILMEDRGEVWIYTNNGDGTFTLGQQIPVGSLATGLAVVRGRAPGLFDLLVGNQFGDILRLVGNGNGTFTPPPPLTGDSVPLDVIPLGSQGTPHALVADQMSGRVSIQAPTSTGSHYGTVEDLTNDPSLHLAPGAVQWAQLEGPSGFFDAVVVASGGNSVMVYRTIFVDPVTGKPTFAAPVTYAVGTDPVAITIQDVNGDGVPDMLVANHGSNDVSVIFGKVVGGQWVGRHGPRLNSGGKGPVAVTVVANPASPGGADLVVTNGQSGTMSALPGRGQGFFDDQSPRVFNFPGNPALEAPSFFGTSGQGVVVTGDGRLLGFDLSDLADGVRALSAPGAFVTAATALAGGDVVMALKGGAVEDLTPATGGVQFFASETGIPSDPSALVVLQGESGLQVLVTNSGEDRVFVFDAPGLSGVPTLPPPGAPAGPVVEVTAAPEGALTLLLTLIAGPEPAEAPAAAEGVQGDTAGPAARQSAALAGGGETADDEQPNGGETAYDLRPNEATPVSDSPPRPGEGGVDVRQKLRGLDLYQPTPNPDRDGPQSRRATKGEPWELVRTAPAPVAAPAAPADRPAETVGDGAGADPNPPALSNRAVDAAFLLPAPAWDWRRQLMAGLALTGVAALAARPAGRVLGKRQRGIPGRRG
jgi:hypothetical protein